MVVCQCSLSTQLFRKWVVQNQWAGPLKISSHWFSEQNPILKAYPYHYGLSLIYPLARVIKISIGIITNINILITLPHYFLRVFLPKAVPPDILRAGTGKIHLTHALELKWYYTSEKIKFRTTQQTESC